MEHHNCQQGLPPAFDLERVKSNISAIPIYSMVQSLFYKTIIKEISLLFLTHHRKEQGYYEAPT